MASGFFALLDDIGSLMDDVASMAKVSTKKTAAILGDDLAVNAEKASGFTASRELPVLWAIMKGSFLNKLIILPIAFLLSAFFPPAIIVALLLGGIYLAYEGFEKVYHYIVPHKKHALVEHIVELSEEEFLVQEKDKIKAAVVTDFILSIEIVIIALGSVAEAPLINQILVVSFIALIATVGVYAIVALIVRMDDFGYRLIRFNEKKRSISDFFGHLLVKSLPWVIKGLGVVGTVALLLVAGGIFIHHLEFIPPFLEHWPFFVKELLAGLVVGVIAFVLISGIKKIYLSLKNKK